MAAKLTKLYVKCILTIIICYSCWLEVCSCELEDCCVIIFL